MAERTYSVTIPPPGKVVRGMCLDPETKRPDEALFLANLICGPEKTKRFGTTVLQGGPPSGAVRTGNGLYQYRLPQGSPHGDYIILVGQDDPTNSAEGGLVMSYDPVAHTWTDLRDTLRWNTHQNARYMWATVNGKCYFSNGFSPLLKYDPNAHQYIQRVVPVDYYGTDGSHLSYMTLPSPRMIGQRRGRIVMGNFNPGAGPYTTSDGQTMVISQSGPRMVIIGETLTDLRPEFTVQVKEQHAFDTDDEQYLVGQIELGDQDLYFLSGSLRVLNGDIGEEFNSDEIEPAGCAGEDTIVKIPDVGVVWLSWDGFWLYDGARAVNISDAKVGRIFKQLKGALNIYPLVADMQRGWAATADYCPQTREYVCYFSILGVSGNRFGLAWNIDTDGWRVDGRTSMVDQDTGAPPIEEKGKNPSCYVVIDNERNQSIGTYLDHDGLLLQDSADHRDYRLDVVAGTLNGTSLPLNTSGMTWLASLGTNYFAGAYVRVLDNRTAAERAAQSFPDNRVNGQWNKVASSTAATLTLVSAAWTGEAGASTVVVGALLEVYWPVVDRMQDVQWFNERSHRRMVTGIRCAQRDTPGSLIRVNYGMDNANLRPDQALYKMPRLKHAKQWSDGDGVASKTRDINPWGNGVVGYVFDWAIEDCSCEPHAIGLVEIEHQPRSKK